MRAIIDLSKPVQHGIQQFLDILLNTLGLMAIVAIIAKFGFYLKPEVSRLLYDSTRVLMWLFVLQEGLRYLIVPGRLRQVRERWLETSITILTLFYLLFSGPMQALIHLVLPGVRVANVTLVYLGLTQFIVLLVQIVKAFRNSRSSSSVKMHPSRLFLLSYVFAISVGTLLLKMPKAAVEPLNWVDALFTATSAVCVTGLMTIEFATALTPLGHGIVLSLFQIGGLGIMTFTVTFTLFLSGGLGIRDRMYLADIVSDQRLGEVGRLLLKIAGYTLVIEFFGAVALYYALGGSFADFNRQGFYSAVFHAVSAFCHAGLSLYPEGLMDPLIRNNRMYTSVIMVMIVVGSLGFPVLKNLYDAVIGRRPKVKNLYFTVATKLILISTVALLVFGTAMIWFAEQAGQFQGLGLGEQLYQSLFLSVTARSAGFSIWPTESLGVAAAVSLIALMWVGGSPMSTAGGIKNLTIMVSLLNMRSTLTGAPVEIFGRHISSISTSKAFAVITISIIGILSSLLLLIGLEPDLPVGDLAFETVSAWGTVGLSRGVTPFLSDTSKVLVAMMIVIGRIGLLTFFIGFIQQRRETKYKLIDENILIT